MKHALLSVDPAVDIVSDADGNIRFLTPIGDFTMRDPVGLVDRVTRRCRDGATRESLVDGCGAQEERDAVGQLVTLLEQRRILTTQEIATPADPVTSWVRHFGHADIKALPDVHIVGDGRVAEALRQELHTAGFGLEAKAACTVAASDTGNLDWLKTQNREAIGARRAFLPVWIDRAMVFWGPLHIPGATGCLDCLHHRQAALSRSAIGRADYSVSSTSDVAAGFAAGLATVELLRWAQDAYVDTEAGMAWSLDILRTQTSAAKVLRLPRCPSCGTAE